jgi:hypothetical protein
MTGESARSNMTGFSFESKWQIRQNGYPILAEQTEQREDQSSEPATVNGTIDIENTAPDPEGGLEVRVDIRNDKETVIGSQTVTLSSNTSTADYSFNVDPANFSDSGRDSAVLADINRDSVTNDEAYSLNTSGPNGDSTEKGRELSELNASETQTENFTVLAAASDLSVTARNATAGGSNTTMEFNGTLNEEVSEFVGINISQNNLTADDIENAILTTGAPGSELTSASDLLNGSNEIETTDAGEFAFEIEFSSGVDASEEFEATISAASTRISEDANASDTFSVDTTADDTGESDIVVAADGSDDYTSIQNAVGNATPGDRIKVESGTYEQHTEITKNITLYAPQGATIANNSVASRSGFQIFGDVTPTISGFTLTDWQWGVSAGASDGSWTVKDVTVAVVASALPEHPVIGPSRTQISITAIRR